ncbi:hypothetical protein GLYMA_14G154401v4 [Glycine max]|nr:hypothetical protein GLYMA_14G154401v4 [Glycine max]KAH1094633.1 hypothetical protein GYH30_040083 [Glycine max]
MRPILRNIIVTINCLLFTSTFFGSSDPSHNL